MLLINLLNANSINIYASLIFILDYCFYVSAATERNAALTENKKKRRKLFCKEEKYKFLLFVTRG